MLPEVPPDPCETCADGTQRSYRAPITMAFQPIVDVEARRIFGHEALVRGLGGEEARSILAGLTPDTLYGFDQKARTVAIALAAARGCEAALFVNILPNAVLEPNRCLRRTLRAATDAGFPLDRVVFEFSEAEAVRDFDHLRRIVEVYRKQGIRTAIDDFGAGYAGLSLLAELRPDFVKIDQVLIRGIDADPVRREIVRAIHDLCRRLGVGFVAEGVETAGELAVVRALGIRLVQGFALGRPAFERLVPEAEVLAALVAAEVR